MLLPPKTQYFLSKLPKNSRDFLQDVEKSDPEFFNEVIQLFIELYIILKSGNKRGLEKLMSKYEQETERFVNILSDEAKLATLTGSST
jgi:hypothetical protein